jgi:hypothetical protein
MRGAFLLDDPRQRRVVHVAHLREEVVLHLEVEPAEVPAEQPVPAREVHRGRDLMRRPVADRQGGPAVVEVGLADAVGELERHGERQAQRRDGHGRERVDAPRRVEDEREDHRPPEEDGLSQEQRDDVPRARPRDAVPADAPGDEPVEVVHEPPAERVDRVERPDVKVLEAHDRPARLVGREAEQRAAADVHVEPGDVRVRVVKDASCMTLNPMPAIARPSDAAESTRCHAARAPRRRSRYEPTAHARITAVLSHIRPSARGERPVPAK